MMSRTLAALAAVVSAAALFLPTRSQTLTQALVDGRNVRMALAGSGAVTVVFENGYGAPLEIWGKVQPHVSRFARTVSYDRAGFGLSESGPAPRDGRRIAVELHRALQVTGAQPPYVLVGASLGGPYVRIFAGLYPDEVAGMVLVDPADPEDAEGLQTSDLPEIGSMPATLAQAGASPVPPGIPVALINAMGPAEVPFATPAVRESRVRRQSELAAKARAYEEWLDGVPGARLVVTDESRHNVTIEQPELVVETIRQVVAAAPR